MPHSSPSQHHFSPGAPVRVRTLGATLLERQADDGTWVVLQRTGKVLAILTYLAARHRPGDWDGHRPEERSEIALWLSHAANEIANGPAMLRLARQFGAVIAEAQAQAVTARILPVINAHLSDHRWLVGDRLTIADLAASPYLALAGEADIDLARWPAIGEWTDRIAALPGFPAMPGWPAQTAS